MSLNTAHLNNGVLLHAGEGILLFSENVEVEFSGQEAAEFKKSKSGRMYLTTHRLIFNAKNKNDPMQSFSFPFITLSEVGIEQPVFGANYIRGKVSAQPNGNWSGEAKFKLVFKSGGAIEYGQAMLKAASMATRGMNANAAPPPYSPPTGPWYEAPPPAYAPPPQGYYGWVPPVNAFPDQPPPNSVFMSSAPPPYPGINPGMVPNQYQNGYPGAQPGYPQGPAPGYSGPAPGYSAPAPGYSGPAPGYPDLSQQGGYPGPQHTYPGYPGGSAAGASAPQQGPHAGFNDAKAAEAAQSAYYDPNRPQMAYVPPPAYYDQPPTYQQTMNKKDQ